LPDGIAAWIGEVDMEKLIDAEKLIDHIGLCAELASQKGQVEVAAVLKNLLDEVESGEFDQ